jgi:hypothetical protein
MCDLLNVDFPGNGKNGEFYKIGEVTNSDKFWRHKYHYFYPKYIEYYKNVKNAAMLEIGVDNKYSLNLWLEYFQDAYIYAVDIGVSDKGERYEIIKADQSNIFELENLKRIIKKPLFLILDDGSHIPNHQLLTFDNLFDILLPGGTYIIEDIECSYWTNGELFNYPTMNGYKHPNSLVEFFKLVIDDLNQLFLTDENKQKQNYLINNKLSEKTRRNISTITFTHNTIIITKKTIDEINDRKNDNNHNYFCKHHL